MAAGTHRLVFVKRANADLIPADGTTGMGAPMPSISGGTANAAPQPRWNWHRFGEGLRDEGVPMAGMVAGAAAGHALARRFGLTPEMADKLTIGGSGIGYGMAAMGNLAADRVIGAVYPGEKHASMSNRLVFTKQAGGGGAGAFIPGALGATLGAATGGGLTQDERNTGRNMLAGAALGYAAGDGFMVVPALREVRAQAAKEVAEAVAAKKAPGLLPRMLSFGAKHAV